MTPPALSLLVLALATPGPQDPVGASWLDPETFPSSLQAELLDNGDFELEFEPLADDPGGPAPARIPWWTPVLVEGGDWERAERGWVEVGTLLAGAGRALPRVEDGALLLCGGADLVLTQPVAAHRPRTDRRRVTDARGGTQGTIGTHGRTGQVPTPAPRASS